MSLPAPLVTVSWFLLSNSVLDHPHTPHHPCTRRSLPFVGSLTLGLYRTGGCHPSQHHVHDCTLALGISHPISPGGSSHASAPLPSSFPPPPDAPLPCLPVDSLVPSPAPSPFSPPRSPFALASGTSDLLLWLQAPLLSTLLHHPLSPHLQFLRFPASLQHLSLALLC